MPDGSRIGRMNGLAIDDAVGHVERARSGDRRAFEDLFRAQIGRVYALCLRLTREHGTAEDCAQETFIRAWRALASFESRSNVATWLHRIAVNVVLERRRRPDRRLEFVADLPGANDTELSFDTPIEEAELESAIESLPPGARDVLVLCGIHGYSHAETGAMLGIAEGTCKAQLHRARALLRARLEESNL